jgi:EmrB/QacA subfamily drug resistance transporter
MPPADNGEMSHRKIMTILSGLMLGLFLAALDQTIVATAIRTISDDLHGLSLQAWATTAYLITSTISTPLYGKLSDLYGRKPLYLTAISVFLIGSLACSLVTDMYQLAAFRALQGLGGGGLMSLALTIIADIVPARRRAAYQGYFMAVFGISSVLGPVIGGFFAGRSSILGIGGWRWVFLVNVPLSLVALLVVTRALNIPHRRRDHRIDWLGALTIVGGLVPLLLVAEQGRAWGWSSDRSWACYAAGAAGLILFVLVESWMKEEALIPLRLFRGSVISLTSLAGLLIGMAMFGCFALLPQYLQIVKGASPTESGLLMVPFVAGITLGAVVSGQITTKSGHYRSFPILGALLMAGGDVMFAGIGADTPLWRTDVYMVVFGLGLGLCLQTLNLAAQNASPPRDIGVVTASATFFRQMGGSLGTAVFLSMLFSTVSDKIAEAFGAAVPTPWFQAAVRDPGVLADPANRPVLDMLARGAGDDAGVLQDSSFIQHLDPRLARPFLVGFSDSMHNVFLAGAAISLAAFVVALFVKQLPLRVQSAMQARLAEETASAVAMAGPAVPVPDPARSGPIGGHDPGGPRRPVPVGGHGYAAPAVGDPVPSPVTAHVPAARVSADGNGGGSVRGHVLRVDGSPVGGAALTLIDLAGHQVGRGFTGGDGAYRVDTPGAGTYVLIVSAGSHQPQASTVASAGDAPVVLDVVLTGASRLSGVVRSADGGAGVAGAVVTLADVRGEVIGAQGTADDGGYLFEAVVPGPYTLAVSARGHQPAAVTVTVPGGGQVEQDVELRGSAQLRGFARSTVDGRAVGDIRVTLLDSAGNLVGMTDTGPDGEYVFADLPEDDYTVVATGYPPVVGTLRLTGGRRERYDVRLGYPGT